HDLGADRGVLADNQGQVGDKPVDRRPYHGAVEVELSGRAVRDCLLVVGSSRGGAEFGVLARLLGDRDRGQFGAPRVLLLGVFHQRLAGGDGGVGQRQSSRITGL